jgi:hypothetical protein
VGAEPARLMGVAFHDPGDGSSPRHAVPDGTTVGGRTPSPMRSHRKEAEFKLHGGLVVVTRE